MSKSKHTPGPWMLERVNTNELWIVNKQNKIASIIYPLSEKVEQETNARLIAAAPDLLRCLKYCIGFISGKHSTTEQDKDEVLELSQAAITKAEKG